MTTKGDRYRYEVYSDYTVINSQIFICTGWMYSHREASVRGQEIFKKVINSIKWFIYS